MPIDEVQTAQLRRMVTKSHFELLKIFGRNMIAQKISDEQKETLWRLSCGNAKIQAIPLEIVIDVWKEFIGGESARAGLAINGDIDSNFTTVGVTFDRVLIATHTTTTRALLERVLRIWRRGFSSEEAFMESVRVTALRAVSPPRKKEGGKK